MGGPVYDWLLCVVSQTIELKVVIGIPQTHFIKTPHAMCEHAALTTQSLLDLLLVH